MFAYSTRSRDVRPIKGETFRALNASNQRWRQYTRRIGNHRRRELGKRELRLVFERGQAQAPTLIAAFKARNVSPLIGLYIP